MSEPHLLSIVRSAAAKVQQAHGIYFPFIFLPFHQNPNIFVKIKHKLEVLRGIQPLLEEADKMSKFDRFSKTGTINSVIQSPRTTAKHANNQVNGETQQTQTDIIIRTQAVKKNRR
ncbi:hypothetical protein CHH56_09160 [Terribacillus saccharophilus]|nr:hypothetical protein CHH56_09160 [Terribacillus saccharophilus]